jgi:DNA polymerase-4
VSIDEAFLDVSGAVHLFGPPAEIASAIRRRVREEIGLPISVGVARTKHLAKIASQVAKPDGLVVVEPEREIEFLEPLPVGLVWGVGPATRARLAATGIHTIGQLAAAPTSSLQGILGQVLGAKLGSLAANLDPRPVTAARPAHSVGAQAALGRRPATPAVVRGTLAYLADRVAGRLRAAGKGGRTVTVRVRFLGMRSVTRAVTSGSPVATTLTLTEVATELALAALDEHPAEREITLLAVSVSKLVAMPPLQLELPLGHSSAEERRRAGTPGGGRPVGGGRLARRHQGTVRTQLGRLCGRRAVRRRPRPGRLSRAGRARRPRMSSAGHVARGPQ